MFVYIVDNNKLTTVDRDTIALKEILLNNITIISNLIDILYISKLSTDLLSINILTKQEINVNFHNNKCCIIAFDSKQILYTIKHRGQYKLQLACSIDIVIALIANYILKYNNDTLKL